MSTHWLGHHHSRQDSPIHRAPAPVKFGVALSLIVGTVLMPWQLSGWFAGVAGLLVFVTWLSRVPLLFLFKRLLLLSPFVLGVALVNALQPTARAGWAEVVTRSVLCLLIVLLVSNTTPFNKVLAVLRTIRVPALLISTMALMHRYLFVLVDESERMRRARASRTFTHKRSLLWRSLATVLSQLFIRASERAERIYDAMCARGWK